jgi:hypothetical protein
MNEFNANWRAVVEWFGSESECQAWNVGRWVGDTKGAVKFNLKLYYSPQKWLLQSEGWIQLTKFRLIIVIRIKLQGSKATTTEQLLMQGSLNFWVKNYLTDAANWLQVSRVRRKRWEFLAKLILSSSLWIFPFDNSLNKKNKNYVEASWFMLMSELFTINLAQNCWCFRVN